jgi:hypothetical protein
MEPLVLLVLQDLLVLWVQQEPQVPLVLLALLVRLVWVFQWAEPLGKFWPK